MEIYLYVGNLSKNKQKGDKYGHMEASGHGREPWAHLAAPRGPQVAMPRPRSVGAAPEPMTSIHSSRFDQ